MKSITIKAGPKREILGFHWTTKTQFCDFFLMYTAGIDFYRLDSVGKRLVNVRYVPMRVSLYWLEPVSDTLVVSSPTNSDVFYTFFAQGNPISDSCEGPSFTVPEFGDRWTTRQMATVALKDLGSYRIEGDDYRAVLARLYGDVLFLILDTHNGCLSLYRVLMDQVVKLTQVLQTPAGVSDIRVLDNLIIVQNLSLQDSYLFDIHMQFTPFFTTHHYESPEWKKSELDRSERMENATSIDSFYPLSGSYISLDQDVMVDLKSKTAYLIGVRIETIAKRHQDLKETVQFLIRRHNCRPLVSAYIQTAIENRVSLNTISEVFRCLILAVESATNETMEKLQIELVNSVFFALCQKETGDKKYLEAVMLEFMRAVISQDYEVNLGMQVLVVKECLRNGHFQLLDQLIQHSVINRTKEVGTELLASYLQSDSRSLFIQCLDLLWSLGSLEEVADLLANNQLIYEACICLNLTDDIPE